MKRSIKTSIFIGSLVLTLAGCGPSKPKFDDSAFIDTISKDATTIHVWVDSVGSGNKAVIALLEKAGYISVVADNRPPWYHLNVTGGSLQNGNFTISAGRLVISQRVKQRQWESGATEYFAETLVLSFVPTDKLKPYVSGPIGPIAMRVVLRNDPAVGDWQIYQTSPLMDGPSSEDTFDLSARLGEIGTKYEDHLNGDINTVVMAAEAERAKQDEEARQAEIAARNATADLPCDSTPRSVDVPAGGTSKRIDVGDQNITVSMPLPVDQWTLCDTVMPHSKNGCEKFGNAPTTWVLNLSNHPATATWTCKPK